MRACRRHQAAAGKRKRHDYNLFFPAALTLAHLARAAAAIFARAAALNLRPGLRVAFADLPAPFILAQRARCAAAILARPAALIPDFRFVVEREAAAPTSRLSWFCRESIFSLRSAI